MDLVQVTLPGPGHPTRKEERMFVGMLLMGLLVALGLDWLDGLEWPFTGRPSRWGYLLLAVAFAGFVVISDEVWYIDVVAYVACVLTYNFINWLKDTVATAREMKAFEAQLRDWR